MARDRVHVSKTKGWVMLNATVAEAEALLATEYHVFEHDSGKEHVGMFFCTLHSRPLFNGLVACDAYNLPAHIVPHVEIVTPSIDFNAVLSKRSSTSTSTHIKLGQPGSGTV